MAKQSIESMYDIMFKMREKMEDLLQDAQELTTAASTYGGEISRVLNEQLTKYFAPAIKKLLDDENTPGAVVGLVNFMDSVPLSYTRVNPAIEDMAPNLPQDPQFDQPATLNNELDNLPRNASFANMNEQPVEPAADVTSPESHREFPQEQAPMNSAVMMEKTIKEASKFLVVRSSEVGSALGDIAKLEDSIVGEFDKEEDAACKAHELNETVTPAERDLLGTKYSVVEKKEEIKETEN